MPPDRRKFVRDVRLSLSPLPPHALSDPLVHACRIQLAAVYRMDTQMVDQEPNRSVQLIRRLDTRLPSPLLSTTTLGTATPTSTLGKLADLRAPATQRPAPQPRAPSTSGGAASRGWTAVVARPAHSVSATPSRSTTPWALAAAATAAAEGAGAAARSSRTSPAPPSQDKADKAGLPPAPAPLAGRGGAGVVDGGGESAAGKEADANVPESWEDDDD